MNEITEAIVEVLDSLPKLKSSMVDYNGNLDVTTFTMVTYNAFPKLNAIIANQKSKNGWHEVKFPYQVTLSLRLPSNLMEDIDLDILEKYVGQSNVKTVNKCVCNLNDLMVRGCTCKGA